MSDLVGNPEDWFSRVAAQIVLCNVLSTQQTDMDETGWMQMLQIRVFARNKSFSFHWKLLFVSS